MSLAKRTVLVFSLLGLCLCAGGYAVQILTVSPAFQAYQRQASLDSVARVRDVLEAELNALVVLNNEYSFWDDTYAFVRERQDSFREENLREDYLLGLAIDLLLIADSDGVERFLFVDSAADSNPATLAALLLESATPGHPLFSPGLEAEPVTGMLRTRRGLLLMAAYPIVRTSGEGPPAGSLAMGRFLTAGALATIGDRVTANIAVYDVGDKALPAAVENARRALAEQSAQVHVALADSDAPGYFLITDVFGAPSAIVEVTDRSSLADVAATSVRSATLLMAAASLFFVLLAWFMVNRFVIRPIRTLSTEIERIRGTGDLNVAVDIQRSDELGVLSRDFATLTGELAQTQAKLEQARDEAIDASNAKSEFLARMSHEIRTPLNGVLGMTEVLRSTPLSEKQKNISETIYRAGTSLLEIINDILDFSKIEAGKLELEPVETDLESLIEETMAAFSVQAKRKGIDLRFSIQPPLTSKVWLDRVRLRQILNNLVGNALKFTQKGSVTLSVHSEPAGGDVLRTEFVVVDTGIGIRPEMQKIIFDSFAQADVSTTRNFGGTGLGLSICQQLVELMGGRISVTSAPDEGSRFAFTLNLQTGMAITAGSRNSTRTNQPRRVLIVDDNRVDQAVTAALVEHLLLEPTVVNSGERGVEAAASGAYDAVLMDCAMPGMDGYAAARAIRTQEEESGARPCLIVALTGNSSASDHARCLASGMDACLTKPCDPDELRDALSPLFDAVEA